MADMCWPPRWTTLFGRLFRGFFNGRRKGQFRGANGRQTGCRKVGIRFTAECAASGVSAGIDSFFNGNFKRATGWSRATSNYYSKRFRRIRLPPDRAPLLMGIPTAMCAMALGGRIFKRGNASHWPQSTSSRSHLLRWPRPV